MKSKDIVIKVQGNVSKFISKCVSFNIALINVVYLDKETILVRVKTDDLDQIKKLNYFCEISKYRVLGIDAFLNFLKRNMIILITVLFCFGLMSFIEGFIVKVEIIHSNKELIKLVEYELKEKGLKPFMYHKNFDELERIKNEIVEENPEKIEWMSITRKGMKYVVRFEERIVTKLEESEGYCHVIAKKAGIIKKITSTKGEILPRIDDYVKKDDIIISGEIKLNEEVKDNTCANGIVMAEVWYKVNLSIPLTHLEKGYTGNKRYNFIINNKKFFKEKYKLYDEEDLEKINIRDFRIKYIREKEYRNYLVKYSQEEALNKALEDVEEKMKVKLGKSGEVLSKKVLKNSVINSKMEVEVFVVALEDIGTVVNYEKQEGEESVAE